MHARGHGEGKKATIDLITFDLSTSAELSKAAAC